ncbi:hypothetical protein C8J56DRAFT_1001727 [Mycena floridula]|nr:hypothetical protein C8J56DRAFT_1001727 [Mycena floridula]
MSDYTRVILVTGSNTGIGYEVVRILASKGHIVYLAARNVAAGKEAQARLLKEHNLNVKFVQLEVTDIGSIQAAKDLIEKAEGRLDNLVNNAGFGAIGENQKASTIYLATIQSTFEPNFFGLIQVTQTFLPLLRKGREGYKVICNVSTDMASNSLQAGPNAGPHYVAYNTSKAAANSYSIALAAELKDEGIKVNCFTPGPIATKLNHFASHGKTPEEGAEMMIPWILLGPNDVDKTGLFYLNAKELAW